MKSSLFSFLFSSILIFDPANTFSLKVWFFLIIVFLIFFNFDRVTLDRYTLNSLIFIVFVILFGLFPSIFWVGPFDASLFIQYLFSPVLTLMIFVFLSVRETHLAGLIFALRVLVVFTILGGAIWFLFWPIDEYYLWLFNTQLQMSKFGVRQYFDIEFPMVYFKTSGLIILSYLLNSNRSNFFAFLSLFALILSGTRANILIGCILLGYHLFFIKHVSLLINFRLLITLISFLVASIFALSIFLYFSNYFLNDPSSLEKYGHFEGTLDVIGSNAFTFLFGSGFGSGFYSYSSNGVIFSQEFGLIEFFRIMGFGPGLIVVATVFLFALYVAKSDPTSAICFLSYIFLSFTNPYVWSSTGALFFGAFLYYFRFKDKVLLKP